MALKITILIEDTMGEHLALKNEHGISFYIEKDGHKILFDTGQSGTFLENAEQLQIDLSDLEYVILSHGHYDHSGGLRALTNVAKNFELIVGKGFFNEKCGFYNNSYEFLGNNFNEEFLLERRIPCKFTNSDLNEILPGIYVITNFPRVHKDEVINPRFKILKGDSFVDDPFDDEVLVAVDTPEGLVVFLGCSHPGMKNMLDTAKNLLEKPLYAVLGGTHLIEAKEKSLKLSLDYLNDNEIKVVGVSHCTGEKAMTELSVSNDRYFHSGTGSSLIVR